ncbi:MAG: LLM class flavin-dependent oxidoreductase [Candidatus Rokuibacteriota bacterium]
MLRLGVLDQSPVRSGGAVSDAIHETLDLAELCDRLGYHRYWLAEHHSTPGLAGSSPEVLIGQVAARTSRIRVGSGGVMLQHYSSLKVAESFRVLETLFPGRIDLGIGRAPGSDQLTARALRENANLDYFPQQISDLQGFLDGTLPAGHVYAPVLAMPTGPTAPEMWLLGSSDQSAAVAAHFGTGFSFAHFINQDGGAEVTRAYRRQFRPSPRLETPRSSAAVFVVCADTEAEARRLAKSRQLFIVRLYTGRAGRYPSIEEAETYPYTERELAILRHAEQRTVAGSPEQVRERLERLAADYEADELIVVTITHDPKARRRSYELLAKVFGLEEAGA